MQTFVGQRLFTALGVLAALSLWTASAWAQKPLQSSSRYSHGHACAVLAMAHWRLGEKDEARAMFEKGNVVSPAAIPTRDAEDPGKAWLAWLYARILLDEAATLINAEQ